MIWLALLAFVVGMVLGSAIGAIGMFYLIVTSVLKAVHSAGTSDPPSDQGSAPTSEPEKPAPIAWMDLKGWRRVQ